MTAASEPQTPLLTDAASEAHLIMFNPAVMVAGQGMYLLTTVAIYFFYRSVVPPADMRIWLMIATIGLSCSVLFCIVFIVRKPGPAETLRFWRKIDKRLTHVFDAIAVAAIFLLFPHGNEAHRLVALAYCVGYGPMQLLADPENLWANRISVAAILGAFSVQLFRMHHDAALILSLMFLLYGSMLIFAAGLFHKAFTATVEQKRMSQQAEAEVKRALAEVSDSRDAKTRFIASASHDLGQPLQAASLILHSIKADHKGTPVGMPILALEESVHTAQAMIRHMLHYLRLEADAVRPQMSDMQVGGLVAAVATQHEFQAVRNGFHIKAIASKRHCLTDAGLLRRALDNLVSNALQHSRGNRILIGAKSAGPGKLRIWVIDNGIGVPISEQRRVFEDFSQGSSASPGGFGLGLASVRRIAAIIGGSAAMDPRWRQGCATYIELEEG